MLVCGLATLGVRCSSAFPCLPACSTAQQQRTSHAIACARPLGRLCLGKVQSTINARDTSGTEHLPHSALHATPNLLPPPRPTLPRPPSCHRPRMPAHRFYTPCTHRTPCRFSSQERHHQLSEPPGGASTSDASSPAASTRPQAARVRFAAPADEGEVAPAAEEPTAAAAHQEDGDEGAWTPSSSQVRQPAWLCRAAGWLRTRLASPLSTEHATRLLCPRLVHRPLVHSPPTPQCASLPPPLPARTPPGATMPEPDRQRAHQAPAPFQGGQPVWGVQRAGARLKQREPQVGCGSRCRCWIRMRGYCWPPEGHAGSRCTATASAGGGRWLGAAHEATPLLLPLPRPARS